MKMTFGEFMELAVSVFATVFILAILFAHEVPRQMDFNHKTTCRGYGAEINAYAERHGKGRVCDGR